MCVFTALCFLDVVIETLDSKMNWLKNYERVQEIQQQIVWKSITELEPRSFVPGVSHFFNVLSTPYGSFIIGFCTVAT